MYNEICYTGGIYDASTGLYYLNARYYDPADKRFLTEDTYRGSENDPNTLHLYAYCANNPVNYVDPSGHKRVRISTWITTLAIDGVLTVFAGWWKWSYDLIGSAIRKAYNRHGLKTASQKLLGAIPKVKGAYSKFYTKIRTAIWRFTGYTIRIGSSAGISNALNYLSGYIKKGRYQKITYVITSLCSLGGAISLALDYLSDAKIDERITIDV